MRERTMVHFKGIMERRGIFIVVLTMFFASAACPAAALFVAPRTEIWVSSPWLSLMARFLGGVYVDVHPLARWSPEGELLYSKLPPVGSRILALDPQEKTTFEISSIADARVRLLFGAPMPLLHREEGRLLDPATMPFVGQRVLVALAAFDAGNYLYYQRRLAEFQSRLESTVGIGRQLLSGVPLLDLTGEFGFWLAAAGSRAVRPPADVLAAWGRGEQPETLEKTLDEAATGSWIVLADARTPRVVRDRLVTIDKVMLLPLPDVDTTEDLFLFLYDQYLAVWKFWKHPEAPTPTPRGRYPRVQ